MSVVVFRAFSVSFKLSFKKIFKKLILIVIFSKKCDIIIRLKNFTRKKSQHPPVAKLDIAADSDSEGRGFESLRAGHENTIRFVYEWYFQLYLP